MTSGGIFTLVSPGTTIEHAGDDGRQTGVVTKDRDLQPWFAGTGIVKIGTVTISRTFSELSGSALDSEHSSATIVFHVRLMGAAMEPNLGQVLQEFCQRNV